jgi:succinate dehydrogenase / fumarate reductase membrane anchor subunit
MAAPPMQTALRRARGLGAAKHGVGAWVSERLTAIALIPLVIWALLAVLHLAGADFEGAVIWLRAPVNAVLMVLLTALSFWHMHSGMRVVIEDYIHKSDTKMALTVLNLFVCGFCGAVAVFSLLKVALMGAA